MDIARHIHLYKRQGVVRGRSVIGIDIGTTNMAAARVVRCDRTNKVLCTHVAIINLKDEEGSQTIDAIANTILPIMLAPELEWIWFNPDGLDKKQYITCERQMQHAEALMQAEGKSGAASKPKYRPPIMFAIYGMLRIIAGTISMPAALLQTAVYTRLIEAGIDTETLGNTNLVFVPRSGSQKLGLKGLHGNSRKFGGALEVGMAYMEEEGDDEAANFLAGLARPKPLQDANDAYLQARHYLNELDEEDRKQAKRDLAAQRKQEKVERSKKNKKRPRKNDHKIDSDGDEDTLDRPQPPTKKAKTTTLIDIANDSD